MGFQKVHTLLTNISLWNIAYPAEGQVILVKNHTQVGESIFDFPTFEKLYATVNAIRNLFL